MPELRACPICAQTDDRATAQGTAERSPTAVMRRLADLLTARGIDVAALCRRCAALDVPSPCVSTCALDPVSGKCRGCQRTMVEIVHWPSLDAVARAEVWLRLRGEARRR
jgi:predicted Fe-S protein YdhL (DUF1289 family)